jgi:integrase
MGRARRQPKRQRVGQVSYYLHHGAWHVYYRDGQRQVRRRVADNEVQARQVAAQLNAQLACSAPTQFSFSPVSVAELRRRFLDHHELVLASSLATVRRYEAATKHLENYASLQARSLLAHDLQPDEFVRYLRSIKVAPNGHANTSRRGLRDKGIRFILEVSRSMYGYAAQKRHLPPYTENPFRGLGGKRLSIRDAKFVFVFDAPTELAFFEAADDWAFPIHLLLAKTGLRPGELVHLLIEEVDLEAGWLRVVNKPDLGWTIKTGRERAVPLVDEAVAVLRRVIGSRRHGPVFLRSRLEPEQGSLSDANRLGLAQTLERRIAQAEQESAVVLPRKAKARLAAAIWREAGAIKLDRIRQSFMRIMQGISHPEATCPKSWRHTFATLLQEANVDPLIRQLTLGHQPTSPSGYGLGMTAIYTHTRPEIQRREITRAMQLRPGSLDLARKWAQGGTPC